MADEGEIIANPEFDYEFAGKTYKVRKANLRQVLEFNRKILAISKTEDKDNDAIAIVPALMIALGTVDPSITEDYILDNASGDIDVMKNLEILGFASQQKVAMAKRIMDSLAKLTNPQLGEKSSQ